MLQEYKCHKSNGVVFCIWNGCVFVSCMDSECRRALSLHRNAYYVMARELEEDIFARGGTSSDAGFRGSPIGRQGSPACQQQPRQASAAKNIHSYKLSAEYVQSVLSQSQADFLRDLRKQKHDLIQEYLT
jgi:hypothetical protein